MEKTEFLDKVRSIVEERERQHGSPKEIFETIAENPRGSLDSLMDIAGYAACAAEVGGLLSQDK